MKMYAARNGRLLPNGDRTPHEEDLVAFYSMSPIPTVTRRDGGEDVDYSNPGDSPSACWSTWGDHMSYTRWRAFGPELVPGTIRAFDFCIVFDRRDAVLAEESAL